MKQVTSIPALGKVVDNQQAPAVKDPENFFHLLKQFSREISEQTNQESELETSEPTDRVAPEDELALVNDSDQSEDELTDKVTSENDEEVNVSSETPSWPSLIGVQGMIFGEPPYENKGAQWSNDEAMLSEQRIGQIDNNEITKQPNLSTEGELLKDSSLATVTEEMTFTSGTVTAALNEGSVTSMVNQQVVGESELSIIGEQMQAVTQPETSLQQERQDSQGVLQQENQEIAQQGNSELQEISQSQDIIENLFSAEDIAQSTAMALSKQFGTEQMASEVAVTTMTSDEVSSLTPTATLDVSNLLTTSNQEPTTATVKQVVAPITQNIEQLVQSPDKKITLQLLPEKLGKVQIALEMNAQGSRLEFTVEQQQTKQLLTSIKSELDQVLQKQETRLFSISESNTKEMATTSIERSNLAQGSLANFASTADGQSAQQSFSQPQRHTGKKVFNPVPIAKEESSELVNHAISILA
jgi:hypothetical protein